MRCSPGCPRPGSTWLAAFPFAPSPPTSLLSSVLSFPIWSMLVHAVHVLLVASLRRNYLLPLRSRSFHSRAVASPDVPVQGFRPTDVQVRAHCFPGCSSPGSVRLPPLSLPLPVSRFFLSSLSTFPDSCSCTPFRFLPLPLLLPHGASVALACRSPVLHRSRLILSGCVASPVVPIRAPCVWLLHLLLFLLPLRVFSPSCPPPTVPCSCSCFPLRVSPPPSPSPCLLPRTFHSRAASSSDVPVRVRCVPGCSCPRHRMHPRTIQSGKLGLAPFLPGCSNPGRLFAVFSPLPRMLQSVAPGFPPDDPVWGLVPCYTPPRMLLSGASFCRILSIASDAPVRGTWFTPGRSSPGASAVLHSAPDAPIRGVFLSYSLRCLGCSSPWHRVLPLTIQSGGLGRAPLRP